VAHLVGVAVPFLKPLLDPGDGLVLGVGEHALEAPSEGIAALGLEQGDEVLLRRFVETGPARQQALAQPAPGVLCELVLVAEVREQSRDVLSTTSPRRVRCQNRLTPPTREL